MNKICNCITRWQHMDIPWEHFPAQGSFPSQLSPIPQRGKLCPCNPWQRWRQTVSNHFFIRKTCSHLFHHVVLMLLSHVAGNALSSADFLAVLQLIFSVRTNWRVTKFVFKYTLLSWVSLQEKQFIFRISLRGRRLFCGRSKPDTAAQYFSPSLGDEIKIIWLSN